MKILLIDNYDSFTYNLLHLIKKACGSGCHIDIVLNDKITADQAGLYDYIIISPGPGIPSEAGNIMDIIGCLYMSRPILGICLGHQAIAEAFGARLECCSKPFHGVKSQIDILDHSALFKGFGNKLNVGRYHSWCVDGKSMPECLKVTAVSNDGAIMAISHKLYKVHGVQFHPESFITGSGVEIIRNFLKI